MSLRARILFFATSTTFAIISCAMALSYFQRARHSCTQYLPHCRKHLFVWSWCDVQPRTTVTDNQQTQFKTGFIFARRKRSLAIYYSTLLLPFAEEKGLYHWGSTKLIYRTLLTKLTKNEVRSFFFYSSNKPSTVGIQNRFISLQNALMSFGQH